MIHLICEEKVIVKQVSLVKLLNILVSAIGHIDDDNDDDDGGGDRDDDDQDHGDDDGKE